MKKSNALRLVSKLVTLGLLAGCMLVVAPARDAKASWIECLYGWGVCQFSCGDPSQPGYDQCLDICGQSLFVCEAGIPEEDFGFKIWP
jgi:hypothetical protein